MCGSPDEPVAERWDPPRVVDPRPASPDHDPQKGMIPSNYQQISCLSKWNLLSGIIAAKISRYVAQYIRTAQKRVDRDTRGAKQ